MENFLDVLAKMFFFFFENFPHNREIAAREYRLLDALWQLIYSSKQAEALKFGSAGHNLLITQDHWTGRRWKVN